MVYAEKETRYPTVPAPEEHMITKRKRIRKALENLPSRTTYEKATTDVYGF